MNKKLIWTVIVIIIIVIVGISVSKKSPNTAENSQTVKIGAISPLTGWGAYWAEGHQKGIRMAVDEINASGGKVEAIIEDGGTEGQKSATAAQKLINIDGVKGIIVEFTAPASAVSPIALAKGVPLIYDSITRSVVNSNPLAFKTYFDMEKECYVAALDLAKNGAKHIGGLIMNLDFAPECRSALEKVSKETGTKVSFYLFPTETTDFRTYISKMKSDGVDAVVPVPYEDNSVAYFKQAAELKFNVPSFLGTGVPDAFTVKVRSSVATSSIEGVKTYDQEISKEFKDNLAKKYPTLTETNYLSAAYGYDETMRMYRSLSQCSSNDCFVSKMKSDTYSGALMAKGFTEDRVINIDPIYYKYTAGKLVEFTPAK